MIPFRVALLASVVWLASAPLCLARDAEPERLLFLLEYVGVDYGDAVRDGEIVDEFEYREVSGFSRLLIERFDVLRRHGATDETRTELEELQELVANRAPWDEVRAHVAGVVANLLDELRLPEGSSAPADAARGRRLYASSCAACHGPEGRGDGFAASLQSPAPSDFHAERMHLITPRQILGAMRYGVEGTAMPSYNGALSDGEMADIAAYLQSLKPPPPAGSDPAADGRSLQVALQLQDAFAEVAERILPSIVSVTSFVREEGGRPAADPDGDADWRVSSAEARIYPGFRRLRSASGFFVSDRGHILTTLHALRTGDGGLADVIDLEFPSGRHFIGRLVGSEPTLDLAVVQPAVYSESRPPPFPPVVTGDSDAARVGHWAIAVGDPWGPERTYAIGTLSAEPRRQCYQGDLSGTLLQASLSIHPESYGGPLVNIRGEVIGMTVPRVGGGSGGPTEFALPINLAMNLYRSLSVAESHRSPWLGFSVLDLAVQRRRPARNGRQPTLPRTGVYIDDVFDPSPASRAGIEVGDSLVSLDGNRLFSVLDFQKWLYLSGIGRTVELEIVREGRTLKKKATIEERPPEAHTR